MASGVTTNASDPDRRENMMNAKATTRVAEATMTSLNATNERGAKSGM